MYNKSFWLNIDNQETNQNNINSGEISIGWVGWLVFK